MIEPFFLIGRGASWDAELEAEIEMHDDFIIADFEDSYLNLPLKMMAMLRFINSEQFKSRCKNVKWIISQDDDVFVYYNRVSCIKWFKDQGCRSVFDVYMISQL